jgi:hypothetical protein
MYQAVDVAFTESVSLLNPPQEHKDVVLYKDKRVLLTRQRNPAENGIYCVISMQWWKRAADLNNASQVRNGCYVYDKCGKEFWVLDGGPHPPYLFLFRRLSTYVLKGRLNWKPKVFQHALPVKLDFQDGLYRAHLIGKGSLSWIAMYMHVYDSNYSFIPITPMATDKHSRTWRIRRGHKSDFLEADNPTKLITWKID